MINILVTGSNGQLGSEIKELSSNYSFHFFFTNKFELDISKSRLVFEFIKKNNIDVNPNC